MIVDLPRRWRWAIGIATVCAVLLAGVFVFASRPPGDALVAQAVAVIRGDGKSIVGAPEPIVQAGTPVPNDAHGSNEVEVCGGAWAKTKKDGSVDPAELARATGLFETRDRILASMRVDPGEWPRAVALLLSTKALPFTQDAIAADRAADCAASAGCQPDATDSAAADRERDAASRTRDAIARMAADSTDPRVYALAYKRCGQAKGAGACQLINARRWAQIDPGNAMPWIHLFSEARARGDLGTQNEALHRIATAERSDEYFHAAVGAILDAAPDTDAALPTTSLMASEAIGFEAAANYRLGDVLGACRGDALRDSNRAQTCAGIADVLADRSASLLGRSIGIAVGRNIGWPADRADLATSEGREFSSTFRPSLAGDPDHDYSCRPLRQDIDRARNFADVGEVGALRQWVAESGKTPQQFIDEQRAAVRSARGAAEQAKAASGPS